MLNLVRYVASALVDDPAKVQVREERGPRETRLDLRVSPGCMGAVVGREGKTARAIRVLLGVGGRKAGRRFRLEISE